MKHKSLTAPVWLGGMSVSSRLRLLLLGLTALLLCTFYLYQLIWNDRAEDQQLYSQIQHSLQLMDELGLAQSGLSGLRRGLVRQLDSTAQKGKSLQDRLAAADALFNEFALTLTGLRSYEPEAANMLIRIGRELTDLTRRSLAYADQDAKGSFEPTLLRFPAIVFPGEERLAGLERRLQSELDSNLRQKDSHQIQQAMRASVATLALTILVALLALLVARSVMSPVRRIAEALDQVSRGARLERSPVPGTDEFGRVGLAIAQLSHTTAHLNELAFTDTLTRLPNRARFEDDMQGQVQSQQACLLVFADLDNFRTINDGYGHSFGDDFLRCTAARLKLLVGTESRLYRYSGDLFAVLTAATDGADFGESLRTGMAELATVGERRLPLNCSFGLARFPEDAHSMEDLVSAADAALHHAKRQGRNTVLLARAEHTLMARDQLALAEDLRVAIAKRELRPYFQPILDIASGKVICVESLARWQHPTRGFVGPDQFISIAENSGQIDLLTDLLLREACSTAARWMREGQPRKLAFNLSAKQVRPGVVEMIQGVLKDSGLPPELFEVEITEGVIIDRPDLAERLLADLRSIGISVALDDFGTGFSSLSYLLRFPIDKIKVDKSFVQGMTAQQQANKIIAATIGLAQSLEMRLVAEGVEEVRQMVTLYEMGCREQQGWLFAKAMPHAVFDAWFASAPLKLDAILRAKIDAA